ncbi:N-acetyltransferase [Ktedonobacter sp. SOSP1-52]|uniref:GNAT family N-acetyltransferase n=1 Tax=Ktedonobacter sp. SOSP1-52 TaxID=2778366 RepID=UPI001915023E|nr:GNAT family N-acetyltransferase [Ktedonobacter sp. SOSP1-52]
MQQVDNMSLIVRLAEKTHLIAAKHLADQYKRELGFINRAIIEKAIETQSLLVARFEAEQSSDLAGLVHFYVRRDHIITLYSIAVAPTYQRRGVGRQLFEALINEARARQKSEIRLKCPAELPANEFYKHLGLQLVDCETGKHRPLNVWSYSLS